MRFELVYDDEHEITPGVYAGWVYVNGELEDVIDVTAEVHRG